MTDSAAAARTEDQEPTAEGPSLFDQPEGTDWALAWLVYQAESLSIGQGITLMVGGSVISGDIIAGRTFFKELAERTSAAPNAESIHETLAEGWRTFANLLHPGPETDGDGEPTPSPVRGYRYIHLRDARIYTPGQDPLPPQGDGLLWRGKLAAVAGFTLGKMVRS